MTERKEKPSKISPEARAVGKLLRDARERQKVSQKVVAQRAEWLYEDGSPNQTRVSHYETGRRVITVVELKNYAKAIRLPIVEILEPGSRPQEIEGFSEEERGVLSLFANAAPEAKNLAEDILKEPPGMVSFFADLYWSSKAAFTRQVSSIIQGRTKESVDVPAAEGQVIRGNTRQSKGE